VQDHNMAFMARRGASRARMGLFSTTAAVLLALNLTGGASAAGRHEPSVHHRVMAAAPASVMEPGRWMWY
jgi:hypothetical protein